MSRQTTAIELNTFNAGLVTDASPLTAPDNSSLDELNMVLNIDGSRNRRLGMDVEEDYTEITTSIAASAVEDIAHTSFRWKNAGGEAERNISVIQFGNEIKFFDLSSRPISTNLLRTYVFSSVPLTSKLSFASIDGMLAVATGNKEITIFEIDDTTITLTTDDIYIRDLFGVEDLDGSYDLRAGTGVQRRPTSLTKTHLYNLRNQSFGVPRPDASGTVKDPISIYRSAASSTNYPSNSDNVLEAFYADTTIATDRTLERFFATDLYKNPLGSSQAASGYFIIDAMERGASRYAKDVENRSTFSTLTAGSIGSSSLPDDKTPGGASTIGEYAGRAWFAGFSGELIDGDAQSPRMSSYVMFSKLVKSRVDITKCYQEGDPTSKTSPDIIATDGGFIRISEAYNISKLVNIGGVLMIIAENGIWTVGGSTEEGFTATTFLVNKVSDRGCINPQSVVSVDNTIFYWAEDGIYQVKQGKFGGWESGSVSIKKIQKLFESISSTKRGKVVGSYDAIQRKIRWIYDQNLNDATETKELILDITLTGFYLNDIKNLDGTLPRVVSVFDSLPYQIQLNEVNVVVGADQVIAGTGNDVLVSTSVNVDVDRGELSYLVVTDTTSTIKYTFANYSDEDFIDWKTIDGTGTDAAAYLITSHLSGTDFQRDKQIPFLTMHLRRTETGLTEDGDNLAISNESSCMVEARWDWADTNAGNRWSRPFQAYRYRKHFIPSSLPDDYDTGYATIVTRNKIRGNGKVISIKIYSEAGKDLHLYGWSMIFSMAGNV